MTGHEKELITTVYNLVKKRYEQATSDQGEKWMLSAKEYKAQCFIVMHLMQTFGFWEEYKKSNDTTTERKWFPDMQ